ncbi:hypothetical protein GCM10010885_09840 [Alicyclobacillus cellulosilyticus]|uniref:Uncharacterized protein n=1 Tax=Alicyclobacillus cellulosilyticus TaxID=1003997 RepID=A0A917NI77_9BACL|nr:hypothetical protein [Alicyclobacillus cellulosilyticus]GGJ02597.1 hypothetical protein GCM10010885_09840 [Alicyclobacillus cellulosilyticus]
MFVALVLNVVFVEDGLLVFVTTTPEDVGLALFAPALAKAGTAGHPNVHATRLAQTINLFMTIHSLFTVGSGSPAVIGNRP